MKMQEVRVKAKKLGVNSFGKKKDNLIRAIQAAEGNNPCFQNGVDLCEQSDCCWQTICLA